MKILLVLFLIGYGANDRALIAAGPGINPRLASNVFVNFANDQLREDYYKVMGPRWTRRIFLYSAEWTKRDAELFLDYMVERVGTESTLERLKSPSYFEFMRYKDFRARVQLFDELWGESFSTMRLNRSLGGFDRGSIEEIEGVIKIVADYIGEDNLREVAASNLQGLTRVQPLSLKRTISFIERYFENLSAGRSVVRKIMQTNLDALAGVNLFKFKRTVDYLERYFRNGYDRGSRVIVRNIMKDHYSILAKVGSNKLSHIVAMLEENFRRTTSQNLLKYHFSRLVDMDTDKWQRSLDLVKEFFGKEFLDRIPEHSLIHLGHTPPDELRKVLSLWNDTFSLNDTWNLWYLWRDFSLETTKRLIEKKRKRQDAFAKPDSCQQLILDFL